MPAFAFASLRPVGPAAQAGVAEAGMISDAQLLALAAESQHDALYSTYKSRI